MNFFDRQTDSHFRNTHSQIRARTMICWFPCSLIHLNRFHSHFLACKYSSAHALSFPCLGQKPLESFSYIPYINVRLHMKLHHWIECMSNKTKQNTRSTLYPHSLDHVTNIDLQPQHFAFLCLALIHTHSRLLQPPPHSARHCFIMQLLYSCADPSICILD